MADGGRVIIFEDVTEREQAEARARFLATHDDLTGLPNRLVFGQAVSDAVKVARRYGQEFAVMFIDLDRFKIINDTLGHAAGDSLLRLPTGSSSASARATSSRASAATSSSFCCAKCPIPARLRQWREKSFPPWSTR